MTALAERVRRLYRIAVKVPQREAPAVLDILASERTEALLRMDAQLEGIGIREWRLVSCEEVSRG